jgi:hypothetical protein
MRVRRLPPWSVVATDHERSGQYAGMPTVAITVPDYHPQTGVIAGGSTGTIHVEVADGNVEITGDPAGLLDLARWCVALAATGVPAGAHVHLDPGIEMLSDSPSPGPGARSATASRCSRVGVLRKVITR